MFKRGISDGFVQALKIWPHWGQIIKDGDLFVAIRNEYINIYYQGCSLFKISFKEGRLTSETHYKYLVHPNVKNPYVSWNGERPALEGRENEILIHEFKPNLLKKSAHWYAEPEKVGVQSILKSNKNVVDVEVALSPKSDVEIDDEDQNTKGKRVADRIDFAAIQKRGGKAFIVFFEAKRFDNSDLKSQKLEPRVFEQIKRYETFINNNSAYIKTSYGRVCTNLVDLHPGRYADLEELARSPDQLTVDPEVRLVVFGYDEDEDKGAVWNKHKKKLLNHFHDRLLLKGSAGEFTHGIKE